MINKLCVIVMRRPYMFWALPEINQHRDEVTYKILY